MQGEAAAAAAALSARLREAEAAHAAELQQAIAAQDEAVQRALAEQAAAHAAELARAGARRMRWALPLSLRSNASPSSPLELPHACVPHAVPDIAFA